MGGHLEVAVIDVDGEFYTVSVDGRVLGRFGALLDANRYALMLLHDGLAGSVRLISGEIIK